jgi:hypothetical protein
VADGIRYPAKKKKLPLPITGGTSQNFFCGPEENPLIAFWLQLCVINTPTGET